MKLYSLFDSNVNKSTEEKTELAQEYGGTSSSTIVMFNLPLPKNTHETHMQHWLFDFIRGVHGCTLTTM